MGRTKDGNADAGTDRSSNGQQKSARELFHRESPVLTSETFGDRSDAALHAQRSVHHASSELDGALGSNRHTLASGSAIAGFRSSGGY